MKQDLINNIKNLLSSADLIYKSEDYTSAAVLYFKSLFSILDFIILERIGKAPKDHTERFRILEDNFRDLYKVLDKLYPIYRSTYNLVISKYTCDEVKENVEKLIKEYKIPIHN